MRHLAVVVFVALVLGCQQAPAPGPQRGPLGSLTLHLKQEGDALAARGDYEAAAVKYQAALNQEPEDTSLRFALGAALSHLGRREATVEQFRFVVSRGRPESQEHQAARRWLIAAGELGETVTFAPSRGPEREAVRTAPPLPVAAPGMPPGVSSVKGRTEPRPGTGEVKIILTDMSRWLGFTRRAKLGEAFEFANVPAGTYELIVQEAESGDELSSQEVTVVAGKDLVLDVK